MTSMFRPDSPFMRALAWLTDVVWINILMIVTSLPVITIGASLTAGYDTARRLSIGEGNTTRHFFRAFKENLVKSTLLWLVFGPLAALIIWSWIAIKVVPLYIPMFAVTIVWYIAFLWVWAVQSHFENSFGHQLWNSFLFGLNRIGETFVLLLIDVAFVALWWASWTYMPQGLFLLAVFGIGLLTAIHVPVVEHGLKPFIEKARSSPATPTES